MKIIDIVFIIFVAYIYTLSPGNLNVLIMVLLLLFLRQLINHLLAILLNQSVHHSHHKVHFLLLAFDCILQTLDHVGHVYDFILDNPIVIEHFKLSSFLSNGHFFFIAFKIVELAHESEVGVVHFDV